MRETMRRFWGDEDGQDIIEYSLLITFIAIACMWFVGSGRDPIATVWTVSNNHISSANAVAAGS